MSYRSFFLAVLSLALGGCAVYDYDNDYYGRRYYDDDDYRVYNHYDRPDATYYIVDHRRHDGFRHDKFRNDNFRHDRRFDGRRNDFRMHKHRFDRRFDDRKFHHDRRFHDQRYDNYQERRHDYTPRLRTWGRNDVQPNNRQHYRVQPGYEARPHYNPRHNNRSDWSMGNRR